MDRRAIMASLVRFDLPLPELEAAVAALDWDAVPLVSLRRGDIVGVLRQYSAGLLQAGEVERWANLIECRDDIEFEPHHEPAVVDAIFDLANPELQGALADIYVDVLARISP